MPLFYYFCSTCLNTSKYILSEELKEVICKNCNNKMKRDPRPPSSKKMEVLDNGWMPRQLERLENAEEIYKERADKHTKENK